jgi:hypothetical protein
MGMKRLEKGGVIESESQASETTEGYFKSHTSESQFVFRDMQRAFFKAMLQDWLSSGR